MTEYTPEQIEELERHSKMLGQIAGWVSDFCYDEESTTEEAVINLVARYRSLEADHAYDRLHQIRKERQQTNDN